MLSSSFKDVMLKARPVFHNPSSIFWAAAVILNRKADASRIIDLMPRIS
jgi:hypothetical protein